MKHKLRVAWQLGLGNIARVAMYRVGLRAGIHPVQRARARAIAGPFFGPSKLPPVEASEVAAWRDDALVFGRHRVAIGDAPPDWFADPVTGQRASSIDHNWWEIPDFGDIDIKSIWEFSRFDWVIAFAQRVRNGDVSAANRLESWLDDWASANAPYRGPNWKCGQEASIRVLHLAVAASILGQERTTYPALLDFVSAHLARIAPTVSYAIAQDNNHATSEAAALFVGGSWLASNGRAQGHRHAATGRFMIERSVARLFQDDGSFSQHSVNYHRLALDTLSICEVWRKKMDLPSFSPDFMTKAAAAAAWLAALTDSNGGDAPVLGANDGARLLQLTPTPYRDHRPSVQLASVLFGGTRVFGPGPHDDALRWLELPAVKLAPPLPESTVFDHGGYAVLRSGVARAVLRYPRYRFRPGQSDALHLDFWLGSDNVLRDGGSYSYNDAAGHGDFFVSTAAHNTVEFDGRDQMPRLGRFLHGDWLLTSRLKTLELEPHAARFGAGYVDKAGHAHFRRIELADELTVVDEIAGSFGRAVLRWRLIPGAWTLVGPVAQCAGIQLAIAADGPLADIRLVEGSESRHYHECTSVPVLEVELHEPRHLTTRVRWAA